MRLLYLQNTGLYCATGLTGTSRQDRRGARRSHKIFSLSQSSLVLFLKHAWTVWRQSYAVSSQLQGITSFWPMPTWQRSVVYWWKTSLELLRDNGMAGSQSGDFKIDSLAHGEAKRKKYWRLKGSEGETRLPVLLGANPRKSSNRFLNNYQTEFALKQYIICGAKLAYTLHIFIFVFHRPILKRRVKATKLLNDVKYILLLYKMLLSAKHEQSINHFYQFQFRN